MRKSESVACISGSDGGWRLRERYSSAIVVEPMLVVWSFVVVVSVLLERGVAVQSGGSGLHVSDAVGAHSVTCSNSVARDVV